jgi:acetyl esterase/lipase
MNIKLITCIIIFTSNVLPQRYVSEDGILRDSSYTVSGYYQKELKKFPFIQIAKPEHTPLVAEEYNLIYSTIGNRNLHIDLFCPANKLEATPIVILIHGGGWRSGDKSFQHPLAIKLALEGYLCATVEYRLSPEAKYPASVLDIKNAIKWLKCNSFMFNADSSKIALLGCSSGGHLAALVGTTINIEKFNPIDSLPGSICCSYPNVQAIVDLDGVLDFTDPAESSKDTSDKFPSVGKLWLGETYKNDPALWVEASPLTYISNQSPAFLFLNSSNARFHAGRDKAIKILNKYDIPVEVYTFSNTPHTFWLFQPWFTQTVEHISHFLKKIFK